jgi:hypothetical protein
VTSVEYASQNRRCAVIYNPTKVSDKFRALVDESLHRNGWRDTLWLETSAEDPGRAMTKQAVAEQVDLVIGAGGDGTIRYVADGLAHTGFPLGLVPAGTGNLLARNLDLPLEEVDAIEVALAGQVRLLDLVRITVDDRPPEHFAVMAGIGIDAMIMDETDEDLKDKVGSAAYFIAAAKALGRLPDRSAAPLTEPPFWNGGWTTPACSAVETLLCAGCPAFPTASPPTRTGDHTWTPDHTWSLSSPTRSISTPQLKRRPGRRSRTLWCWPS